MSDVFAHRYPNINRFVFERGWIENGSDDYNPSLLRALDSGGSVWEGKEGYELLDDALTDLERGLAQWMNEIAGQTMSDEQIPEVPSISDLSPDEKAEQGALNNLSDDALRTIAREQMPDDLQARMQVLMDKNTFGTITSDEYAELESLVERGQQLMIRKAQAAVLLVQRGYTVTAKDMTVGE